LLSSGVEDDQSGGCNGKREQNPYSQSGAAHIHAALLGDLR
jgi:hypothetical protein